MRRCLSRAGMRTWVAEVDGGPVGYVSAHLTGDRDIGEIFMLAVDPGQQNAGIGLALVQVATDWMRDSGARIGCIGTGGDPGHAPARHVYEKAGYTPLPLVQYFKAL